MNAASTASRPAASFGRQIISGLLAVARVFAAVVGGFMLSTKLVGLGGVTLTLAGMRRDEATLLCGMLGYLTYLGLLLWAFAERRVWLVWLVLFGGAAIAVWLTGRLLPLLPALK